MIVEIKTDDGTPVAHFLFMEADGWTIDQSHHNLTVDISNSDNQDHRSIGEVYTLIAVRGTTKERLKEILDGKL